MSDTSPMVDTGNPQDKADLVGRDNPVESVQEIGSFHSPAYSMTDIPIQRGRKTLPPRGAPWELPLEC